MSRAALTLAVTTRPLRLAIVAAPSTARTGSESSLREHDRAGLITRQRQRQISRPLVLVAGFSSGAAWHQDSKVKSTSELGIHKKKTTKDTSQEGLREVSSTQPSSMEPDLGTGPQEEGKGEEPSAGDTGHLSFTKASLFKLTLPLHPTRRYETSSPAGERAHSVIFLLHSGQPLSYIASLIRAERPSSKPGDDQVAAVNSGPGASANPRNNAKKPGEEAVQYAADQSAEQSGEYEKDQGSAFKKKEGNVEDEAKPQEKIKDKEEDYEDDELLEPHSASSPALGTPPISFHTRTGDGKRWSPATGIGDFLRDAARTGSFVISVGPRSIGVAVPSFKDRTRFLRASLYAKTAQIERLSKVKGECDKIAHEGSRRVAFGGAGILATWWVTVCYLTFFTSLGWDVLEPVSYLVGLGTLGGGYFFFLFYNKEVSYRAVLTETMSRRQAQLYVERGFSPELYSELIDDVKQLRRTIKTVAREYGDEMTWDQGDTESGKRYKRALDIIRKREAQDAAPKASSGDDEDGESANDKSKSKGASEGANDEKEPEQEQEEEAEAERKKSHS